MSSTMQRSVGSAVAPRWYPSAVMALVLALVIVAAVVVYLAVRSPAVSTSPASNSGTVGVDRGTADVCYRPLVPC